MELRLDRLLAALRDRPEEVLGAIDRDPMLLKKESGGLVLANASQLLFTPQEEHQLFAKGIVYRRDPYRLVSLPLIKIYNIGERDVTVAELAGLAGEEGMRLRFLRKIDGSLVQAFRADGRVWLTTRGVIEGAKLRRGDAANEGRTEFDYLGAARRLAERDLPRLLSDPAALDGRTLIFELIHPGARNITNYGDRTALVLLAAFDHRRFAYLTYPEVAEIAARHGFPVVDALSPAGATFGEQIDGMMAALAGTDQEGAVVNFERGGEVIYRVKVKTPDYLRLLRLMAECTYDRTAELMDAHPQWAGWPDFEAHLKAQGRENSPEELLAAYRGYYEQFTAYLADCEQLRAWAEQTCRGLEARLGGRSADAAAFRKAFAGVAVGLPYPGLVFAAFDGRLTLDRVRKILRTPAEARTALAAVRAVPAG